MATSLPVGLIGVGFIGAGLYHFVNPVPYLAMMPPWLPAPGTLVAVSGWAEIAGGIGVLVPTLRRAAGWGLIALLLAVFPANVHVALHGWPGVALPAWVLWLRLPLQPVLVWGVYRTCLAPRADPAAPTLRVRLRHMARRFKDELVVYRRVWRDPRTPRSARWLLGCAIGYLTLPFDLIPDFIPVLGQLDDVVIIPLLVYLALRRVPPAVLAEHRAAVAEKRLGEAAKSPEPRVQSQNK